MPKPNFGRPNSLKVSCPNPFWHAQIFKNQPSCLSRLQLPNFIPDCDFCSSPPKTHLHFKTSVTKFMPNPDFCRPSSPKQPISRLQSPNFLPSRSLCKPSSLKNKPFCDFSLQISYPAKTNMKDKGLGDSQIGFSANDDVPLFST